jgi:hypothetical protein
MSDLRQALDDKPPVKTYAGGKPNYCTPEETFTLDRGCYERGCVAYDERDGDGVNISAERVDETAKGEHEPIGYIDGMHGGYMVFTPINPAAVYLNGTALYLAPPKKEWVGLTGEEARKFYEKYTDREELIYAIDEFLEEKNT